MINVVDHVLRLQGIESNCSREVSARRWDEGFQTEWSGVGPDGEEGVSMMGRRSPVRDVLYPKRT